MCGQYVRTILGEVMKFDQYGFSEEYAIAATRYRDLIMQQQYSRRDKLRTFALAGELEVASKVVSECEYVLSDNLNKLFAVCVEFDIPRIYIGHREIVGADRVRGDSNVCAIWQVAQACSHKSGKFRFYAGCGNADQAQVQHTELLLPPDVSRRAYDVASRTEIATCVMFTKNFVTGG